MISDKSILTFVVVLSLAYLQCSNSAIKPKEAVIHQPKSDRVLIDLDDKYVDSIELYELPKYDKYTEIKYEIKNVHKLDSYSKKAFLKILFNAKHIDSLYQKYPIVFCKLAKKMHYFINVYDSSKIYRFVTDGYFIYKHVSSHSLDTIVYYTNKDIFSLFKVDDQERLDQLIESNGINENYNSKINYECILKLDSRVNQRLFNLVKSTKEYNCLLGRTHYFDQKWPNVYITKVPNMIFNYFEVKAGFQTEDGFQTNYIFQVTTDYKIHKIICCKVYAD